MLVAHLIVAMSEDHRHDLLRDAARTRRSPLFAHDPFAALTAEGRLRVRASLAELWDRHRQSEVETAGLLGDWAWGYAKSPRTWPEWRTVLDWGGWVLLLLLASYHLAAGG